MSEPIDKSELHHIFAPDVESQLTPPVLCGEHQKQLDSFSKKENWDREDQIIADMVSANPYLMALFRVKLVIDESNHIPSSSLYAHDEIQGLGIRNPDAIQNKLKEMGKL